MGAANYPMSVRQAMEAAHAFVPFDLLWLEDPTIPDDCKGYSETSRATGMPLATWENLHTRHAFEYACADAGLSDIHPARRAQLWWHNRVAARGALLRRKRGASVPLRYAGTTCQPRDRAIQCRPDKSARFP